MNIKGFRRMLFGEQMPDKNDPKYKERYERDVDAGRKFAKATRIDKAAAKERLPPDGGVPLPALPQDCHGDAGLAPPGAAQGPAKDRNKGKQGGRDTMNDVRTASDTHP